MKNSNLKKRSIKDLFNAKESLHRKLAKLPFEEKIKRIIKLQEIINNIRPSNGRRKKEIWKIS